MKPFPNIAVALFLFSSVAFGQVKIITTSLPGGTVDTSYSATVSTTEGAVPFTWKIASGSLPAGISLTPSEDTRSAVLSGTPTTAATYEFTVFVEGRYGHVSEVSYSVTIQPESGASNVIDLQWDAPAGDIVGYNVFRSTVHGGPYTQINSSLVPSTQYSDSDVVSDTTYYYVTTAIDSQGEQSSYSNEAEASVGGGQ